MRAILFALALLFFSSCSDQADDADLSQTTSESDADVASVRQAAFVTSMPELIMLAPVPSSTQGLSWTAFGAVWSVQSYDAATTVTSYRPNPDQITNIGFSAYATGPGLPTCTRIGSGHAFSCNGVTINCPSASLLTTPLQWRIGGPVQPWRSWADSGNENWVRANAVGLVPTSSNVQRINDRSVVFCYHDRAGKVYQLRRR
jgi:hypothetical protein